MEAIVLAGGLGIRLQSVVHDVPKPMSPIGEKPFLTYLLRYLAVQGVQRVILSTGYHQEVIERYFGDVYEGVALQYSREDSPLGTGGAIKQALNFARDHSVFIVNGDTFFRVNLARLRQQHMKKKADISMALKHMYNYDRFGTVVTRKQVVMGFTEKRYQAFGKINGGIYVVNKPAVQAMDLPDVFSFEAELLQNRHHHLRLCGFVFDEYFIDIGIPEDYHRAQRELAEK